MWLHVLKVPISDIESEGYGVNNIGEQEVKGSGNGILRKCSLKI